MAGTKQGQIRITRQTHRLVRTCDEFLRPADDGETWPAPKACRKPGGLS